MIFVAEIRALQTNLTLEQIREKEAKLKTEVSHMGIFGTIMLT